MYDYKSVLQSKYFGEAYLTTQRNRVKIYGSSIYLKDKQEFEIELFNPTNFTKLAKISINGKLISQSGLIIKPGQRVYLERFIDIPKKFQFDYYDVDGSSEAQAAIAENGNIEIKFYDEYVEPVRNYLQNDWNNSLFPSYTGTLGSNTFTYSKTSSLSSSPKGGQHVNSLARSGAGGSSADSQCFLNSVETGRVEQGGFSDQKFKNYIGKFNNYTSNIVRIKILPLSQKPQEVQDLAEYCTNCGTKNKKNSFKYCPTCGNKF